ncbi:MAG TPA: lipid-binding SYLF domain-containing protein [Candidatus Saccharimonadales bacterium]|nr:lipid-binding SYLF domain-containing protein [Candidatus Saccharimonadales bacterium]
MNKILIALVVLLSTTVALAGDRADDVERLRTSSNVIKEIMSAPDSGVPEEVFSNTKCVAVIPSMFKAAFGVGGAYGKGVASCRTEKGWSAPAFFSVRGGSFGFQIGGQAADIVMLIMNDRGMNNLLQSKFKLGADASVAAGPVGRHADASTDWKMRAQVLTYSRTRGVFAGISLNGAVVSQHQDDTRDFYGRMVPFKTILLGNIDSPKEAAPWRETLIKYAGK